VEAPAPLPAGRLLVGRVAAALDWDLVLDICAEAMGRSG